MHIQLHMICTCFMKLKLVTIWPLGKRFPEHLLINLFDSCDTFRKSSCFVTGFWWTIHSWSNSPFPILYDRDKVWFYSPVIINPKHDSRVCLVENEPVWSLTQQPYLLSSFPVCYISRIPPVLFKPAFWLLASNLNERCHLVMSNYAFTVVNSRALSLAWV